MLTYTPTHPSPTLPRPLPSQPAARQNAVPVPRPSFTTFPAPSRPVAAPNTVKMPTEPQALKPAHTHEQELQAIQDLLPKPSIKNKAPKSITPKRVAVIQPPLQTNPAVKASPQPSELPEIMLSMRDALVMLQEDIPRAIHIIETKENAYSQGYLAGTQELRDLLLSPALTSLIRVSCQSEIQALNLTEQLAELTIPRIAEILLCMLTALEARGTTHLNTEKDQADAQTEAQTLERTNSAIENYLASLPQDTRLKEMMETL